jgi:type IV pilus assembly protein PilB
MATAMRAPIHRPGALEVLVEHKKISLAQAKAIALAAMGKQVSPVAELVSSQTMTARDVAKTLAGALACPLLDLNVLATTQLPRDPAFIAFQDQFQVLVLARRSNRLLVAGANPCDQEAEAAILRATKLAVEWVVVEYDKLPQPKPSSMALTANPAPQEPTAAPEPWDDALAADSFDFESVIEERDRPESEAGKAEIDSAPVVRFFQSMLDRALKMGASDLHFEPYETSYRVRFRIDGEMREIAQPPTYIKEKLASRIKVLARLDISEKRVPQDGRMKLRMREGRAIDFRVSTLPTLFGEKVVIRILDSSVAKLGIEALGYEADEKGRLMHAIGRPNGMILVTGPTGSGKTVSLYSCLNMLNREGVNIATAEDPSEINLPGVNQVNVNEKTGLTFAAALKSFLRQDPDIIMVGEIRDLETADIAIKAAQTGHLVLSTLHTNDAPATLNRLRNMGIAPFNIASSVILITAQRLTRKLCPTCKIPQEIPQQALLDAGFKPEDLEGNWTPYQPVGCPKCNKGFKGRVGIYQVMPITEAMQRLILQDASQIDIAQQAQKEGVRTMRESGLLKVKAGLTSIEEILGATNE